MLSLWDRTLLRTFSMVERYDRRFRRRRPISGEAAPILAAGQVLGGRYRLDSVLGEGGMGRVWLAEDQLEKRRIAFKEMRSEQGRGSPELDVAFKREFYTMTKLQHPNTVHVFDCGMLPTGDRYLTMEVVRGKDLSDLLKRGPLELKQLYRVLIDLANVLGFIHSRLFVHCDVKSANIRISERGVVKLMDFGLMHQLGTPAASLKGTPHYMAPEVPKGGVIDARTDLYSLGVLAFELATGQLPFTSKSLTALVAQHIEKKPPSMQKLRELPEAFEKIVLKLLEKEPRDRYQDSGELTRDLAALSGLTAEVQDYGARTSYLYSADLIGRDAEQKQLKGALEALIARKGKSLHLTAPAGTGKTRLLQEFRLSVKLADIPFFVGQCRAEGQAPLTPLVEALAQLLPLVPSQTLRQHGPALARMIPQLAARGVEPVSPPAGANPKAVLFEALRGLVRETAAERPFVLCLEDLHWADSTTVEFLNVVIRELAGTQAMVLGTFRSNEVDRFSQMFAPIDDGTAGQLEVAGLSPDNTAALIGSMLRGIQLPQDFAEKLFASTQGNAFFITETLRALIEQQVLKVEAGRWSVGPLVGLPDSIEGAVGLRLASLSAATLALCRCIAPLGRVLDLRLVKRVSTLSDETLFGLLDELVERQFLAKVEDQYYFSHDTVRSGVYLATPIEERRIVHERIGNILEALHPSDVDEHGATIGYHFARGTSRDKAVRHLGRAGTRALSNGLLLEGTRLLAETADLLEQEQGPQAELLESWSKLIEIGALGHPPTCVKFAEKLCPMLEQRVGNSEGFKIFNAQTQRLADRPGLTGRNKLKRIWADHPLDARSSDPMHLVPKVVVYRNAQAFAYGTLGQTPKAMEILNRLLSDNPQPGPFRAATQISKAVGLFHMGSWSQLRKEAEEATTWFEDHLQRVGAMPGRLLWNYVATLYWQCMARAAMGLGEDAALLNKGLELSEKYAFNDWRVFLGVTRATGAAVSGIPEAMQESYGPVADTVKRLGSPPLMEGRLSFFLPAYYLQRGEKELAEAAISKLERIATTTKDAWMRRYGLVYRAQLAAAHGPPAQAAGHLEAALAAVKEVPSFARNAQLWCTQAKLQLVSNRGAAQQLVEEALKRATTPPAANPWDECITRRTLAEVLVGSSAVEAADAAVAAARRHQMPMQEALSLFALAVAAETVDRPRAAQAINEAESKLEQLKCTELLAVTSAWRRKAGRAR
jgi:tetratricopeptide (TPR) repeat protein